jgi:hypothetical protein
MFRFGSIVERCKWLHWAILIATVCHVFAAHSVDQSQVVQLSAICQSENDQPAAAIDAVLNFLEEIVLNDTRLPEHSGEFAQFVGISLPSQPLTVAGLTLAYISSVRPWSPPELEVVRLEDVRPMQNAPPLNFS